jgi:NCS1 family nucleobase:cation symporter-1
LISPPIDPSTLDPGTPHRFEGAEFAPDSRLYNDDLAPTLPAQRTWSTYNYLALWFSMSMEVTTYMLAASLIAAGMNWKQAVGTILLGNLIVLIPMLLNAHAGTKYGIPFPVFVRASFGPVGANIPAMLRAIVACGWFGIQSWIGGTAIAYMVRILLPSTEAMPWLVGVCFIAFWLLNMFIVWRGVESIRFLQSFSAPFMVIMSLTLLIFMYHKAGGFGPMLSDPGTLTDRHAFFKVFFPALTAMVGYWATLSLNIPDFTRYAKNQDAQIVGQAIGLPVAMVLYSFLGIAVTSASIVVFHHPVWSPVELLGRFHQPLIAFLGLIALLVATLNVNIGANVVGPSNDFSNLAPKWISFRTGGLITGSLGLLIMPWRLVSSSHNYLGWLVDYSGLLGPVAGIMVADYFLVRHTKLDTLSLYRRGGIYEYRNGFNLVALFALAVGISAALIGKFVPRFEDLFTMAWFVGFFLSGALYYLLMLGHVRRIAPATELSQLELSS